MRTEELLVSAAAMFAAACGSNVVAGPGAAGAPRPSGATACAAPTFPATFEAEDAMLTGVQVSSQGKGFSGTGYVTGFSQPGQQVTFTVCAPAGSYFTFDFTYAKGTDGVATRTLIVDGRAYPGQPVFTPVWTLDTWVAGGRRSLHLDAGSHQIALSFENNDTGEIRLDKMTVSSGPAPTHESVRSLFMNNWKDLMVGWHAAKLYSADDRGYGPRMLALHWAKDWPISQIDEAEAFFRDETGGTGYTAINQFDTSAAFTASDQDGYGELRVVYGDYGGKALPMSIVRRMSLPPGEQFVVVLYDIGNVTDAQRQISILEWAKPHNKTANNEDGVPIPGNNGSGAGTGTLNALWDADRNAWIADLSETNGTFVVMGAFDAVDHHVAGAPVLGASDSGAAIVQKFAGGASSLTDTGSFSATNVSMGMSKTITLDSTKHAQLAWFYGVADSMNGAKALADHVRQGGSAEAWMAKSSDQWKRWLLSGAAATLQTPVPQWAQAFQIGLITGRQSQQPEFGSIVASTNPAYEYKVWVRDASVSAMLFDAAGYVEEADKFWSWMAQVQADGSNKDVPAGTWWTNYSFFAKNTSIHFVEPELDSVGLFLIGIYRHHQALKARDAARAGRFLDSVWPVAQKAADFIQREAAKPENFGFSAQDHSIWEEDSAYEVFTQTTYSSGLRAAQLVAKERNDAAKAQAWSQTSGSIAAAIFRDATIAPCPGAWNSIKSYFIRGVRPDCTRDERVDASTDLLWIFGLLDAKDRRAAAHRGAVLASLTPGQFGFGISRYEGDQFYHSTPFDPGHSHDAKASMAVWPQMSMYMAMLEHWLGMDDLATSRLSWYVAVTASGYQPPGEAVDWTTELPIVSTSSEPVTAAWFGLALLNQLGVFDPRLP
jgi:GH15 family glucan-1,4-alpha-glucosidase